MISQALIGLVPAFFAVDGLSKVSGLDIETGYIKVIVWAFAVIIEILGIAILKQSTETFLAGYKGAIPPWVPISCGIVYVINMILLTTLHNVLPVGLKSISIGLLCVMPVVGYVSAGLKSVSDDVEFSQDDELKRKREVEDKEREFNQQLRTMREESKLAERTKIVPKSYQVERPVTEERIGTDESGTVLGHIEQNKFESFGKVSKATGIPKTTVVRIIGGLVNAGKLYRNEDAGKVSYELNGYH